MLTAKEVFPKLGLIESGLKQATTLILLKIH
jgi:hypothetical protein